MLDLIQQNWTVFDKWMKTLTDGEAAFYVFFLGLLIGGISWLLRRITRKQEKGTSSHNQTSQSGVNVSETDGDVHIHQHYVPPPQPSEPTKSEIPEPPSKPSTVIIDKLPTVPGEFFGREEEQQLLTDACFGESQKTNIIQFVAAGGTGKTKLLRHWLDRYKHQLHNRIIWSFYSQGTTESKQVSLSPLLDEAFKTLGVDQSQYRTETDKADAFVDWVLEQGCLLVLDGLEPMQHIGRGMDGQLKDKTLVRVLKRLAGQAQSTALCIITIRVKVHELCDRADVISHPLDNLSIEDGIRLLQSHNIQARHKQLKKVVKKVGGHALTLHLLGNAIAAQLYGDVQKLDTLTELVDEYDEYGRHAFKVMQAYAKGFRDAQGQPLAELQMLYLLGLFDHPIEIAVLQVLWQAQIPDLTQGIPNKAWKQAIHNLQQKYRLLSQQTEQAQDAPALLDCHPLIREYFGKQLKQNQPEAYKQAHKTLYEYYKSIPKQEQPKKLEDMRPLFHAVAHGCAAGMHQQALDEVFWTRIRRESECYTWHQLGAFSDDLAVVAHFFDTPWHMPAVGLEPIWQAGVLNWAGFCLRALGRLREALEPMQTSLGILIEHNNWENATELANNLSELQLILGDVSDAMQTGELSASYGVQSKNWQFLVVGLTAYADALHQAGQTGGAQALFETAEQQQQERQPKYPRLYSLWGYRYCDLLLAQGKTKEVSQRAHEWKDDWDNRYTSKILPDISWIKLTLARIHLQQQNYPQATEWLQQSVTGLRNAGTQHHLSLGLLTRAALYRQTTQFNLAQQDLDEVFDIAEPSSMRLHLTDYHLESARLGFDAAQPTDKIAAHIKAAADLIQATGYHRRDAELARLQECIRHSRENGKNYPCI